MSFSSSNRIVAHHVQPQPYNLASGHFDFVLAGASWDKRCLTLTESLDATFGDVQVLRYTPDTPMSGEVANLESLLGYFTPRSKRVIELSVNSRDLVSGWAALRSALLQTALRVGRPLDILVDLNSIPRYWTLGLLAFASRSRVSRTFSIVYADAVSYTISAEIDDDYSFTSGEWAPVTVPGLGRPAGAAATSHLVVSAGFEGRKTRRLVHALEPDRLSILLANSSNAHRQISTRANVGVAEDFGVNESGVEDANLMDLDSLVNSIRHLISTQPGDGSPEHAEQLSFLLAGPKLASFAMALAALDSRVAQVYYVAPERRNISSSAEIGSYLYCCLRI